MKRELPKFVSVGERTYPLRNGCDYRVVLDCLEALGDARLADNERLACALTIFYDSPIDGDLIALTEKMGEIISCSVSPPSVGRRNKPTVDFEKDFPLIASALLPILGYDIREERYLHWWTFLGAFREIRNGVYADVLRIRAKRAAGVALTKEEKAFYAQNTHIVDITCDLTDDEREFLFG